jgi:hypothetical protein
LKFTWNGSDNSVPTTQIITYVVVDGKFAMALSSRGTGQALTGSRRLGITSQARTASCWHFESRVLVNVHIEECVLSGRRRDDSAATG